MTVTAKHRHLKTNITQQLQPGDMYCTIIIGVVPALHGVRRRQYRGTRVERCDDSGFGDGHGLLLHGLVQDGARLVCHLRTQRERGMNGGGMSEVRHPFRIQRASRADCNSHECQQRFLR